ncbi:acyltransferase domain-containing protein [Amycolatopsis sp. NPDC004378]
MNDPAELRRWLTERLAGLAGVAPEVVDAGVPIAELGLSSRDAVTVAAELGELLGREPDLGLLGRYPSITALVTALAPPVARPAEPVAVLGVGGRPEVAGPGAFDAEFFGVGPAEAAAMDPRLRILLETTWAALEHAGLPPGTLRGSRTGVFVGVAGPAWFATGPGIADGVAERFDLRGPSLTLDASALAAVHQAVRALAAGEADLVLAAGAHVMFTPPSDGEGCGVVVLKRLADARRDGDRVLAVVRDSAIGRSAALGPRDSIDVSGSGAAQEILGLIEVVRSLWHDRLPPGIACARGTNAHVVLEGWPKPLAATPGSRWNGRPQIFTVSARSETALRRRAGDLADWLAGPGRGTAPGDLAATLARRRDQLPLRAAVVTSSRGALIAGLRAMAEGGTTVDVVRGTAGRGLPRPVFVFPGYGSQWPAMGRRMLGAEPEFRAAVAALEPVFLAKAGFSLRGALRRPLGDPAVVAPLVFGLQVALAEWWRAHGVEPAAVVGHSSGEVAAAVVAGVLDVGAGLDIVVGAKPPPFRARPAAVAWYSSGLDDPRAVPDFDADYRILPPDRPAALAEAIAAAVADGYRWFVEISPHPIALPVAERTGVRTLATLSRRDGEEDAFARSLAELHVAGHPAALDRRYPEAPVLDLPPPPWERRTFRPPRRTVAHPLLGTRVEVPEEDRSLWQAAIAPDAPECHRVDGVPVFPATGFLELVLAGAREVLGTGRVRVDGLEVHRPLVVTGETVLSTEIRADGAAVVRAKAGAAWVRHATAWVAADTDPAPSALPEGAALEVPFESGYALPPALADACLGVVNGRSPTGFGRVRLLGDPRLGVRCLTDGVRAVQLVAADGEVVVDFGDVRAQDPGGGPLAGFATSWPEVPLPPVPPGEPGSWLLLTDEHPAALGRAVALALALAEAGDEALSLPQDDLDELPGFLAGRAVRGVVFLTGAPHAYHDPEDAQDLLLSVLSVVARLGSGVRFHLVTQSSGEPGLVFLRGLVRVLAFDRPGLRASLVDCDARSDVDVLVRELRSDAPDDEVLWRHDVRYAARLERVPLVDGVSAGPGAYVITGALGLSTARWLADNGATRIVLLGGGVELSEVDVVSVAGDIAEPGVAERLVAAATADGLPLRGIVHAADDSGSFWRAKVLGARRLHEATSDVLPDWWLLYSSAAALLGAPGRTADAVANAWLDAFAAWRRSRGLPATSVNWGADVVVDALPAVLAADRPSVGVARLDVTVLPDRPFFSALPPRRLADIFAEVLGREVSPDVPLIELGLDSLTASRARAAAERELGLVLPVPLLLRGARLADLTGPSLRVLRSGDGAPLVVFGEPGTYRPLLDLLGGIPCYGVEAADPASCVPLLREGLPSGPYRLAGWASGGRLAFETAQRLTALGERVDVVLLVDPDPPAGTSPYAGRVVLFPASAVHPAWTSSCPDLHVEPVPGDHRSMLDLPHVEVLARHVAAELAGRTTPGPTPV